MSASPPGAGFELVSGPDLGGGFLHQLSVERHPAVHQFVYHAQDGGPDANGPPIGSPEPFGYRVYPTMCPLGGRACWHRAFTLPLSDSLRVRAAYNRTRFVFEAMLAQAYRGELPTLPEALAEVAARFGAADPAIEWYLRGSSALWARGAPVSPPDLEVGLRPDAVPRAAEALREYVTEPAGPTEWNGRPVLSARAFVGTLRSGARVGWSVPLDDAAIRRPGEATLLLQVGTPRTTTGTRSGLPVSPLEATVVALAASGEDEVLARCEPWLLEQPWDREGFERYLQAAGLTDDRARFVRRFGANRRRDSAPSLG
jgi:hypothetical protein